MTSSEPDAVAAAGAAAEAERLRRRRAAELLGDLVPGTSSDETDEGWGDRGAAARDESDRRDAELLRDVPPHH